MQNPTHGGVSAQSKSLISIIAETSLQRQDQRSPHQICYSPNPAVNQVIHALLKLGLPPIPVAPKPNSRAKWCHRVVKTKDGWLYCPVDKELNPITKFTGKNPSFLDRDGSPRICLHGNYQDKLPTEQELKKFFCNPATGVGTLGGHGGNAWIDIDAKCYESQEACDADAEAIIARGLSNTWIERTGSGGWRIAVKLRQPPTFTNFTTDDSGTHRGEALFVGRFTVLAPSIHPNGKHYRRVGHGEPVEVESLESIGIYPAKEEAKQKERSQQWVKRKQQNPNYRKTSNPSSNPWDIRNFAQYFEGYTERDGWGYAQCPHHPNPTSFTSFRVNLGTGQTKLWCNCDPKDVWKSGLDLAISRGYYVPERQQEEPTISREDWEYKFKLSEWLKHQIEQFKNIFKKASKPNPEPKATKPAPTPKVIRYVPGDKLPTLEQHRAMGSPIIQFAPGQRLQLIAELIELGYHDILDSSATGTSKSHDVGCAEPARLGSDRLWYFSADHRNPTTAPVEGNYADMTVRNSGYVKDETRRTPSNYPHIRWPRYDEEPDTVGNCFRTGLFHTLAAKGYAETGTEAKTNPICGTCHLSDSCAGKGDAPTLPGASFRKERHEAFLNDRIRSSLDSAAAAKELEAKVSFSEDGTEEISNRNGAFVDEAMRQLKPTEEVQVHLSDFNQTCAEIESKRPEIHEQLKSLRLALRPILAGEIPITQETYHGWRDAAVREALEGFKEKLFGAEGENNNLIMPEIIEKLESIKPNLREILTEPDGFNKSGAASKDRAGISNETSKYIRSKVRQESYRDIAAQLRSLPINWLIPFLEVWSGAKRGALRIDNEMLTVTTRSTRHAEALKAMEWVVYLDATATREYLALHLDVDPLDIVQIEQEQAPVTNLTIVEVTDLGVCGKGRSDDLQGRLTALKPALKTRHDDIGTIEKKQHADPDQGDGWWHNDNRGSNRYLGISALASYGIPYQNIGALQDLWLTLTGDRSVAKDAFGFSEFVDWQVQSEIAQCVGRLRANLRPDENLTYYSCGDFDLEFLKQYYPGATIKQESAFNIIPEAGTKGQRRRWSILEAARQLIEDGQKLTQDALAKATQITQGRVSQIMAQVGGWKRVKRIISFLINPSNSKTNKFDQLTDEEQWIAQEFLPAIVLEDPVNAVQSVVSGFDAYGEDKFKQILDLTPLLTRAALLKLLVGLLPTPAQQVFINEFRPFLPSAPT